MKNYVLKMSDSLNTPVNGMNYDRFDLFIKFHRIFGLTYYGYYEKESKIKQILYIVYNLIMYTIVLTISSPCLLNSYYCEEFKKTKFINNDIGFKQIIIYYLIRNLIGIASGLIFSIRGKKIREIINDLRKLFNDLKGNQKDLKSLYLLTILLCSIFFLATSNFARVYSRNFLNIFILIFEIWGTFYICLLFLSTDIFIGYFTTYLVIIQKLFKNLLTSYNEIPLNADHIRDIKFKFLRIQSLIDRISNVLSPLILLNCTAIFYNIVVNFYFIVKSFEKSIYYKNNLKEHFIGISFYLFRLLFFCFSGERIKNQVFFIPD